MWPEARVPGAEGLFQGGIQSAARSRGSRGFRPESRVPLPEEPFEFVIENLGPCLEQEMCFTEGPLHLLLLDEPPADAGLQDHPPTSCRTPSRL